jgi:hypothetical protein
MDTALPIIAILGFFTGSLVVKQVLRWIALLSVATAKQGGDFLGPPRRRLLWVLPFVVFFHPGLYMISALIVSTGFCLLNWPGGEWGWFLAGLYICVVVSGLLIASKYRRCGRNHTERRSHRACALNVRYTEIQMCAPVTA